MTGIADADRRPGLHIDYEMATADTNSVVGIVDSRNSGHEMDSDLELDIGSEVAVLDNTAGLHTADHDIAVPDSTAGLDFVLGIAAADDIAGLEIVHLLAARYADVARLVRL